MKKVLSLLLALGLLFALCTSCGGKQEDPVDEIQDQDQVQTQDPEGEEPEDQTEEPVFEGSQVNLAVISGPTGVGAAKLISDNKNGGTVNTYNITVAADNNEVVAMLSSGEADIAALATNVASTLYQKTNGGIQMAALNTLGVLYVLEQGDTVHEVSDLAGKTIYTVNPGANPEFVLNYILRQNGLEPGEDVNVEFKDASELTTLMATGQADLCMLPVPAATTVLMKNAEVRSALDMTEEWNKVSDGVLTMGCIVVRTQFAQENPEAVQAFLEEYAASVDFVKNNVEEAAQMVADAGITGSAEIAAAAIPQCALVCITGEDIQPSIQDYYDILYAADPSSVGGALPDDAFYYIP